MIALTLIANLLRSIFSPIIRLVLQECKNRHPIHISCLQYCLELSFFISLPVQWLHFYILIPNVLVRTNYK